MDDFDSDAMAQAMGFASFGAQNPPSKRRRFNPAADAVVAQPSNGSHPVHPLPPRPPRPQGSAANSIPLGIRPRTTANSDEIDLGEDDEGDAGEPEAGSARPVSTDDVQSGNGSAPDAGLPVDLPGAAVSRDQVGNGQAVRGGRGRGGRGFQPGRGQGRDGRSNWWEDYYDPSTNVNPWERLEQDCGLQPRGSWMTWEQAKAKA